MGHTFHLCCIEKRMWLNEWLDWMQHLLISQKCQPPSSPDFPPPPYKMNDVKSMMPLPGAVWMTDLNKIGKAPLGYKKLAFIQQQAVSLPASCFPTRPAQLSERSVKDGRLQQGGGAGGETRTRGTAALTGCGMACFILATLRGAVAKLQRCHWASMKSVPCWKHLTCFTECAHWGKVNRARAPL